MNKLTKIAYNCRKATFLIEKKQIGNLSLSEKIELKIHLAGCSVCRLFQQQSIVINTMVRTHLHGGIKLDDEFKKDLQDLIDKELNKN